jgi:hypothetical protein
MGDPCHSLVEEGDRCGNCAGPHRTSSCQVKERACVSCKTGDHASWSRLCPAFTKRVAEFDVRNPDNSLQFFPTADTWTWSLIEKPAAVSVTKTPAPAPTATATQIRPSKVQLGKWPQPNNRYYDTYIPDYSNHFTLPHLDDMAGWFDDERPSSLRPANQVAPSIQSSGPVTSRSGVNNSNSNENPPMPHV